MGDDSPMTQGSQAHSVSRMADARLYKLQVNQGLPAVVIHFEEVDDNKLNDEYRNIKMILPISIFAQQNSHHIYSAKPIGTDSASVQNVNLKIIYSLHSVKRLSVSQS